MYQMEADFEAKVAQEFNRMIDASAPVSREGGLTWRSVRKRRSRRRPRRTSRRFVITDDKRLNIPTAEHQSVLEAEHVARKEIRYPRNTDLDPQLVWRGKDYQDWSDLVVQAPPLYIQEKVHPKVLIDDLLRESKDAEGAGARCADRSVRGLQRRRGRRRPDRLLPARSELDQPDDPGRLAPGDGEPRRARGAARQGAVHLHRPAVRHQVQQQLSVVNDEPRREGREAGHITREPEQVKAFRDTWRDGIHSYLTYLRDRLTVARDLLDESGSIFVQIGDENVHRVRALMDEVFGDDNFVRSDHVREDDRRRRHDVHRRRLRLRALVSRRTVRQSKYRPLYVTEGARPGRELS